MRALRIAAFACAFAPCFARAQWVETITPNVTPVKAAHIVELRTQIDSGLAACGLPAQTWTNATLTPRSSKIAKVDIDDLRAATTNLVNAYRAQASLPPSPPVYTDPVITAQTTPIKAAHINELRTFVTGAVCNLINGVCGPANGVPAAVAPVAGLCSAGNPTAVAGAGPWTWSCTSPNGGATDNCSTLVVGGATCGSAHLSAVAFPPVLNLCSSGVPTVPQWIWSDPMSALYPIKWDCVGTSTVSCKAQSLYSFAYCFVAGTQVTLKSGKTKAIEDIVVGEEVQTYDEVAHEVTHSPVEEVLAHEEKLSELYTFHYDGKQLTSNDQHRLFLPREGSYFSAAEIYHKWRRGEKITFLNARNSEVAVTKIEVRHEAIRLYNLHVKGRYDSGPKTTDYEFLHFANHNYFANGVLAHNVKWCGGMSGGTAVHDAAMACESVGPSGNDICNLGWNVMKCSFQTPADLNAFNACAGPNFDAAGSTCVKPSTW